MDRCAIFVDAGHLLAQCGSLCCGTGKRGEFTCNYVQLINAVAELATRHCGLPLLRIYWYDGANNYTPTLDHLTIANLPNVKLRLGRVYDRRQKGVDALIYRDLMTLARERAMATAYLLAGDEDLREGVVATQEMGVRVVLLGIPSVIGNNQSEFLVREADEHTVIEKAFWMPFFARIPPTGPAAQVPAPEAIHQIAALAARDFAARWAQNATADELQNLLGHAPRIPSDLDAQLIKHVQTRTGSRLDRVTRHMVLRTSFWKGLRESLQVQKDQGPQE